jgi:acyl-CoA synthetase (NDP forming)
VPDESRTGESFARLAKLLEPRSVAVIGASDEPGSLGGRAVALLQEIRISRTGVAGQSPPRLGGRLPCFRSIATSPACPISR